MIKLHLMLDLLHWMRYCLFIGTTQQGETKMEFFEQVKNIVQDFDKSLIQKYTDADMPAWFDEECKAFYADKSQPNKGD